LDEEVLETFLHCSHNIISFGFGLRHSMLFKMQWCTPYFMINGSSSSMSAGPALKISDVFATSFNTFHTAPKTNEMCTKT